MPRFDNSRQIGQMEMKEQPIFVSFGIKGIKWQESSRDTLGDTRPEATARVVGGQKRERTRGKRYEGWGGRRIDGNKVTIRI